MRRHQTITFGLLAFLVLLSFASTAPPPSPSPPSSTSPPPVEIIPDIHKVPTSDEQVITLGIVGYINRNVINKTIQLSRPILLHQMIQDFENIKPILLQPVPSIFRKAASELLTVPGAPTPSKPSNPDSDVDEQQPVPPFHKKLMQKLQSKLEDIIDSFQKKLKERIDPVTVKGINTMADAALNGVKNYFYIKRKRPTIEQNGEIDGVPANAAIFVDKDNDGIMEEVWFDASEDDQSVREELLKELRKESMQHPKSHPIDSGDSEDSTPEATVESNPSKSKSVNLRHRKRFLGAAWTALQKWYYHRVESLAHSIIRETNNAIHNQFLETTQSLVTSVHTSLAGVIKHYMPEEYLEEPSPFSPEGPRLEARSLKLYSNDLRKRGIVNYVGEWMKNFEKMVRDRVAAWMKRQLNSLEDLYKDIAATVVYDTVYKIFPFSR
ncbi:hypothetical protein BKA69DRAFT_1084927, partial [Paraphysoderma sedebokerense]